MTNEEKILDLLEKQGKTLEQQGKALENVQADVTDVKHTQQEQAAAITQVADGQKQQGSVINHIATAIKALATKQDVERVEKEVDKIKQKLRPPRADY
jgi:uncharacterized protein Yka (UPF0111/DUF47 family)